MVDGATTYTGLRPDGGDYADALAAGIEKAAADEPADPVTILRSAIATASERLQLPQPSAPSAALALAQIDAESVRVLVLGDAVAVVCTTNGRTLRHTDDRIARTAAAHRRRYRNRLRHGAGYDDGHRDLLRSLQAEQRQHRNTAGGFWVAANDPAAADHAYVVTLPSDQLAALVLASDGAAAGPDTYGVPGDWRAVIDRRGDLPAVLDAIHHAETDDPAGQRWPRAKRHDDKAVIIGSR